MPNVISIGLKTWKLLRCHHCSCHRKLVTIVMRYFANAYCPYVALHQIGYQSWKKNYVTISLFFCRMTAEVSRNNCTKKHKNLKIALIYFRHLNVSWVKAYDILCLFIFTSIYPLARLKGLAVEMFRMKRLLN